jgi:predicted naringenin-chalcone synthase
VLTEDFADGESQSRFYPLPLKDEPHGPATEERMRRYAEDVVPLAATAARAALADAALSASAITHLVTVSCTGFVSPGVDLGLIDRLGLSREIRRCHVGFMGCHGALNGLETAAALAAKDPRSAILMCAAELCTLHFQYQWSSDNVIANSLFADGAAAVIAAAGQNVRSDVWRVLAHGSLVVPETANAMTWRIGNHGFTMTLSQQMPRLIEEHLPRWLPAWLGRHDLTIRDVASWIVHPGGPRILDAVENCLGLPAGALLTSREVLSRFGNMSSPTVLFILELLRKRRASRPCVMLAFGPGLCIEAALLN